MEPDGAEAADFRQIAPSRQRPSGIQIAAQQRLFQIAPSPSRANAFNTLTVNVPPGRGVLVPLTSDTTWIGGSLGSRFQRILLDPHGNLMRGSLSNRNYQLFEANLQRPTTEPSAAYLAELLKLSFPDRGFLDEHARAVTGSKVGEASDSRQVATDLTNYFLENFKYQLESDLAEYRRGRSELRTFLEDERSAHCEFFATATALMLRSRRIPARLSTGYLVYEMDDDRESYLAMNSNAHAWVEAWIRSAESGSWSRPLQASENTSQSTRTKTSRKRNRRVQRRVRSFQSIKLYKSSG